MLVTQTSFCEGSSGELARHWLFSSGYSQARGGILSGKRELCGKCTLNSPTTVGDDNDDDNSHVAHLKYVCSDTKPLLLQYSFRYIYNGMSTTLTVVLYQLL